MPNNSLFKKIKTQILYGIEKKFKAYGRQAIASQKNRRKSCIVSHYLPPEKNNKGNFEKERRNGYLYIASFIFFTLLPTRRYSKFPSTAKICDLFEIC